jgi:hypothetical protein
MNPDVDERPNWRDLRPLLDNAHLLLALRVAVPDARIVTASEQHAWAIDPQTGPQWPAQANSPVPDRQEHRTGRAARTLGRERQRRSGRRRKRDVTWSSRAACSCRFVPEGLAAYSGGA